MTLYSFIRKKLFVFNRIHDFYKIGMDIFIDPSCYLPKNKYLSLGDNIIIERDTSIIVPDRIYDKKIPKPVIEIGDGTCIGQRGYIGIVKGLKIGKKVTIAPNVCIVDHDHGFYWLDTPICDQELIHEEPIEIGDGSWIGYGAVILSGTKLGKKCVVGANAVVKGEFPDSSVIVGYSRKVR